MTDNREAGDRQVIVAGGKTIHYWPSTGGWKVVGSGKTNRGAEKLAAFISRWKEEAQRK